MAEEVKAPEAPKHLPKPVQQRWQKSYLDAHREAMIDHPEDRGAQHGQALREANRLLRIPPPASLDEARKLEDWQIIAKGTRVRDGVEHEYFVTADGKKHYFPVEEKGAKAAGKSKDSDAAKAGDRPPAA